MKQQIKQHISNCKTCFAHKPSKSEAKHSGLSIPMENLSPMDWLSTDLMEVKDKTGKKSSYLIIVDRASAFVRAYKLAGTKTKNIISSLEEFVKVFYTPPCCLLFSAANRAITDWANDTGINHDLSAAYSPQSNGEAEAAVKWIKQAIAHSDGTPNGIKTACHNINWEQRADKSGFPVELFLHCSPRFPGLATIPHKLLDSSEERRRRDEGRSKQIERINKNLREPEIFSNEQTVYL